MHFIIRFLRFLYQSSTTQIKILTMEGIELVVSFLFFCVAVSEFQCPLNLQTTSCKCKQISWWNNENKTIVNCSMANLKTVPNFNVFDNIEITHLILSNNNISEISMQDFTGIVIREIDLSANPIVSFDTSSMTLPIHLNTLIMRKSKVAIDKGLPFFRGLENLSELILDFNIIENESQVLPGNLFKDLNLKSLKKLSLQSCEINGIDPNAFIGLEQLEEVDLSYNYLEEVPSAIKNLKSLKKLILLGNNIMHLKNNTFDGLSKLQDLNLNVNEIKTIDTNAFIGVEETLKDVRLYYNNLNTIPYEALRKLKVLSFLVISRNNIQLIPRNAFVGFKNLQILELDSNTLTFYNEMFAGLENSLETLTLRDTGLVSLPVRSLLPLNRLVDLDVSKNKIHTLSRGDIGMLKLKTIDLSNNALTKIDPDAFLGISRTISLDLDYNKLTNISFVLKVTPCAFSYIDVSGNDIICDCDTEKIISSGIVLGVGPTGTCKLDDEPSFQKYELGSRNIINALTERCNQTERVYDCQNMALSPNSAEHSTQNLFLLLFTTVTFIFLYNC